MERTKERCLRLLLKINRYFSAVNILEILILDISHLVFRFIIDSSHWQTNLPRMPMPTIEQLNFFQAPLTGVGFRMLTGLRFSGIGRRFFAANVNQRQYLAKDGVFDDKVYDNLFGMSISPSL
jgi:hypothetical protein